MSHNSHLTDEDMHDAAELMHHHDPKVRKVAAIVMRMGQNRPPLGADPLINALLDRYTDTPVPSLADVLRNGLSTHGEPPRGAHAIYR
jgi:hypothetical protein